MSEEGAWLLLIVALAACIVASFIAHDCGANDTEVVWRNRLVDAPEYVEAVKVEVLAERAREKLESAE